MLEILNGRLPSGQRANLRISHGQIVNLTDPALVVRESAEATIDASGLLVLPGLIDPHVHFRVPGLEHKEDWDYGVAAALRGGVTCVFDMPNTDPPLTTLEALHAKVRQVGPRALTYRFWFGTTPDNWREIPRIASHGVICGVKTFLGSSTGNLLVTDDADLYRIAEVCTAQGLIWGVHCEEEALMQAKISHCARTPRVADHCRIRDTLVEVTAVERVLRIAADVGCAVYLLHLSAPESVERAHTAKQRGSKVWVETCPHYLVFSDRRLWGPDGAFYKVNPALRTPPQVARLRELICREDFIDTVASDHAPHQVAEKHLGDYQRVPSGLPGVQHRLSLLYAFVERGEMSLPRFVALTARNAAQIFGLSAKGEIAVGRDADLVLFDPGAVTVIRHEAVASKCGYTPYDGLTVAGAVRSVIVRGAVHRF